MRARSLPWLLQHFEKTLFSAALAWLLVVSFGFISPAHAIDAQTLSRSMGVIRTTMRTAQPEPIVRPAWKEQLESGLAAPAAALPFGPWIAHQRPQVLFATAPELPPLDCRHFPSAVTAVDASVRGRVSVEWAPSEHGEHVRVAFVLERRAGDGPWSALRSELSSERRVVDRTVEPNTTYAYRVVSRAVLDDEEPLVIEHGLDTLPPGAVEIHEGAAVATTTPSNTIFVLNSVRVGDPVRRIVSRAQIFVYRWNAGRQKFDRRLFRVAAGERVGADAFQTDAVLTNVRVDARPIPGQDYTQPVGVVTLETSKGTLTLDDRTGFTQ